MDVRGDDAMKHHPRPLSYLLDIEKREQMDPGEALRYEAIVLAHLGDIVSEEQWEQAAASALKSFKKLNPTPDPSPAPAGGCGDTE